MVHVVGLVDDAQLAAMFRRAAAFVTVSEHEGFCVPLLEAMAFDVPVVARACAAIPETVGRRRPPAPAVGRPGADRRGDRPRGRRRRRCATTSSIVGGAGSGELTAADPKRRDARDDRRGRVMRILYVVQRYGEQIAGGAEQHARAFAERMVERGHQVTVLTTCAASYVDWGNRSPAAGPRATACRCTARPVALPRNPHLFGPFNARMSGARGLRPLSVQRDWMQMQGPYAPEIVPWLRRHARGYDVGRLHHLPLLDERGRACASARARCPPCSIPTAHDEPPLRLSIFEEVLRAPDEFVFLTPEERDLVHERFPGTPAGRGGRASASRLDDPGDAEQFRARFGLGADPYLLYVGRVDPAKGAAELIDYFVAYKDRNPGDLRLVLLGEPFVDVPGRAPTSC